VCDPPSTLTLVGGPGWPSRSSGNLRVANPSRSERLAFKVKSTRPEVMAVTPKAGFLEPGERKELAVTLEMDQQAAG